MSSELIPGEAMSDGLPNNAQSESNVDERLNTLRETVLQLLDEVESLTISVPVDVKNGARFSDEVRQFEVNLIRAALGRTSGSQSRAAKLLGLTGHAQLKINDTTSHRLNYHEYWQGFGHRNSRIELSDNGCGNGPGINFPAHCCCNLVLTIKPGTAQSHYGPGPIILPPLFASNPAVLIRSERAL